MAKKFLRDILRNVLRDNRGNSAMLFGLTLPVLVGFAGLGTDVSYWYLEQRRFQESADIAAHSGAAILRADGDAMDAVSAAEDDAEIHHFDPAKGTITVNTPPLAGAFQNTRSVEVEINSQTERFFSGLFTDGPQMITVRSVATYEMDSSACILALNTTASRAINITGNNNTFLSGCSVMSDSVADDSFYQGGSSDITAPCVRTVGQVDISSGVHLTDCDEPLTRQPYVADPFSDVPEPAVAGPCLTVPSGANPVLMPGRYCGGLNTGNADATFTPGQYIIDGGTFRANGGSMTGTEVTFFLANDASTQWNGNAYIDLSAPSSGDYDGILLFGERTNTAAVTFNGTADSELSGALYFPNQEVDILGDFAGPGGGCMRIVGGTVTLSGSATFEGDCVAQGVDPIAIPGMVQIVE